MTGHTYRTNTPVHSTGSAWRQTITDGTQPICRALGNSRSHAVRNAEHIIRAVRTQERLDALLATPAGDLEEFGRVAWLRERLQ